MIRPLLAVKDTGTNGTVAVSTHFDAVVRIDSKRVKTIH